MSELDDIRLYQDAKVNFFAYTRLCDNAATDALVECQGFRFLYVERSTTATGVQVRFNHIDSPLVEIALGDTLFIPEGVRRIYFTHTAQAGAFIKLILSVTSTITPAAGSVPNIGAVTTLGSITDPVKVINDPGTCLKVENGCSDFAIVNKVGNDLRVTPGTLPLEVINDAGTQLVVKGIETSDNVGVRGTTGSSGDALKVRNTNSEALYIQPASGVSFGATGKFSAPLSEATTALTGYGGTGITTVYTLPHNTTLYIFSITIVNASGYPLNMTGITAAYEMTLGASPIARSLKFDAQGCLQPNESQRKMFTVGFENTTGGNLALNINLPAAYNTDWNANWKITMLYKAV